MALYLTFKPPFSLSWMKHQIVWLRSPNPQPKNQTLTEDTWKLVFTSIRLEIFSLFPPLQNLKTYFIEPVVGLFNFQQKLLLLLRVYLPFPRFYCRNETAVFFTPRVWNSGYNLSPLQFSLRIGDDTWPRCSLFRALSWWNIANLAPGIQHSWLR